MDSYDIGVSYAKLGFIVFLYDNKGMGKTDGNYLSITDFDQDIVEPAIWIFKHAINEYIKSNKIYRKNIDRNKNYFLSGHSMGGATVICIALKEQEKKSLNVRGIIILAPMCKVDEDNAPKTAMDITELSITSYFQRKLIDNGLDKTTNNEKVDKLTSQDPIIMEVESMVWIKISLITECHYLEQPNLFKIMQ